MVTKLKEVDAVVVGMGWTGAILSRELTKAGLNVVGLERGPMRTPRDDFAIPAIRDELKYTNRHELFQDTAMETVSLRHAMSETALPMRRHGSFLPGTGVGGAGSHWNGATWRNLEVDYVVRSHYTEKYGRNAIPADMTVQDFGVTYAELEPHFDKFEKLCGISGQAGNLRGKKIDGGNIFEGPRANDYPNKPLARNFASSTFDTAARSLGYHPFPQPSANASEAYTNPEGATMGQCVYCGFCERYGCESNAKASPNVSVLPVLLPDPKFELRTNSYVKKLNYDRAAKKVTSVTYVDTRTGEEYEQPAGLVILGAYVFNNTLLMLYSGIGTPYDPVTGRGSVGKNYCYQYTGAGVTVFFEDAETNPFMAAGAFGTIMDDFNGDNFDHSGLGFIGGGHISAGLSNGRPIETRAVPPGTPRWGKAWKEANAKWYRRWFNVAGTAVNYAYRDNYLDLDPTYKDALGRPLIRMTYNFKENDYKIGAFLSQKSAEIAKAMNPTIMTEPRFRRGDYDSRPYQSTHNTGGTIMGTDPSTSVVNRYLQSWDASNLFIMGASVFPQNQSYNPTGPLGALAYWSADAIVNKYMKAPGPLMQA
ncbi:MAG: GMC family oxidoreductase [Alphaproteobacteria bacterium]|nr:GMC family oxidoreductase [Alphaproteobacteria bacterium]